MGSSRLFDAVTEQLVVTDTTAIQGVFTAGGTASCWLNLNGSGVASRLFDKTSGATLTPTNGWMFYIQNASGINLRFWQSRGTGGMDRIGRIANTDLNIGTWYFCTVVYDSSSAANSPSFYLNGVAEGSTASNNGSGNPNTDVGNNLFLGGNNNDDRGLDGTLCHCQLWNRILTQDEIVESMYKPGSVRLNLVGYWPAMGSDSPERDLSGNGNSATVTGATQSFDGPLITKSR